MRKINDRLYSWASILDEVTLEQARRTATLPVVEPYLALMPDAHLGKGATIGSVIPTRGAIIPAAVGVDIGCGMRAVRTTFTRADLAGRDLGALRASIERAVPLSAGQANRRMTESANERVAELESLAGDLLPVIHGRSRHWRAQLGTLGSGNHFLEVTLDETDRVWLFLHSGSRGVGNRIAQHHIAVARGLADRLPVSLPDPDLAWLTEGTEQFDAYVAELNWAQHYALLNRDEMMDRMVRALSYWIDDEVRPEVDVNCHHNYSTVEEHFGRRVWVSRKGAIFAGEGAMGLIPGSMGTASYVVRGRGNAESLHSAPHGAGRVHSRNSARRTFTMADLRAAMVGIEYAESEQFLDEIPAAYKDIDVVMADAADLVQVVHELHQIVNVKGA